MIAIICKDGVGYGLDFDIDANKTRITKSGKVKFSPTGGVKATLEFPSPAVKVQEVVE